MFWGWTVCSVSRLLVDLWLQPCPPPLLSCAAGVSESGAAAGRRGTGSLPLAFCVPQPVALLVFPVIPPPPRTVVVQHERVLSLLLAPFLSMSLCLDCVSSSL